MCIILKKISLILVVLLFTLTLIWIAYMTSSMERIKIKNQITSVNNKSKLVWIDLEMTGLDPKTDVIIEIAVIITDNALNIIEEGPNIAIHQPTTKLDQMDNWNKTHHSASGLLKRVKTSTFSTKDAEKKTLEFIQKYCKEREAPLCGNSIFQDRRFLTNYMPKLNNWLHYRNLDVSTIKELMARWQPDNFFPPKKKGSHKALTDIRESIEELAYYKKNFFKNVKLGDQ